MRLNAAWKQASVAQRKLRVMGTVDLNVVTVLYESFKQVWGGRQLYHLRAQMVHRREFL